MQCTHGCTLLPLVLGSQRCTHVMPWLMSVIELAVVTLMRWIVAFATAFCTCVCVRACVCVCVCVLLHGPAQLFGPA